jgi:preprotein translocase subunit SecG
MITVILVIHLLIAAGLVGVILLQRSEGGALGIGGGGGGGMSGFLTGRGTANLLTRTTTILAVLFFVTSLALARLAGGDRVGGSLFGDDPLPAPVEQQAPTPVPQVPPAEPAEPAAPIAR